MDWVIIRIRITTVAEQVWRHNLEKKQTHWELHFSLVLFYIDVNVDIFLNVGKKEKGFVFVLSQSPLSIVHFVMLIGYN